jgi:hypothetical protein
LFLDKSVDNKHAVIKGVATEYLSELDETLDTTYAEFVDGSILGSLRDRYFVLSNKKLLKDFLSKNHAF